LFKKVLIANRGEIAIRIVRACHELGIRTVLAYSEADRDSLAVRYADECVCIGPAPASASYLNIPAIVTAALITGVDALHPGYGFLSENAYLAEICEKYGIAFIGPSTAVMEQMSDKALARRLMKRAGLPVIEGADEPVTDLDQARQIVASFGYPAFLKAVAGGGGRGLRVVRSDAELATAFPVAQSEAHSAFGHPDLYVEKCLEKPRHIEVQILADKYAHVIHLGQRDCSIQRRHQKIVEESPAPNLLPRLSRAIGEAAVKGARAIGYSNAGTIEFLVDGNHFYFLEVNARIQVEHPVTEMVTGIDLVKWQILLADGARLTLRQKDVRIAGHAIECRVNAEDPDRNFAPDAGVVDLFLPPGGPGVRMDSHLYSGYAVPPQYDSLLGKIVAWGRDREEAIARMKRALTECVIGGVKTTIPFQQLVLSDPAFERGEIDTSFVEATLANGSAPEAERCASPAGNA
jgi:acetyl-CoA carboxylase, biotin carboxylase subunit